MIGSLLGMACDNCGEPLDLRWKYCIHCGAPVASSAIRGAIPGAIRPAPVQEKTPFDWQVALGILLAVIGVAVIVFLLVVLVPHA